MRITAIDSNGKVATVGYTTKAILHRGGRRVYGWAIKPDMRRKHPTGLMPHTSFVVEMAETPKAGQSFAVLYTFTPLP